MSAPTNISALTATEIHENETITQTVDDSGTTYTVWYKLTALTTGVIGVWAFGDLTTYTPGYHVYYNNGTTDFMNYQANPNNAATFPNRPFLIPVTGGITYYFEIDPNSGNPSPATLTLSTVRFTAGNVAAGDFLTNREVDDDYEHPLTVASGAVDYQIDQYVQVAPPLPTARSSVGLPHGHYGVMRADGSFIYADDQYGTLGVFGPDLTRQRLITTYDGFDLVVLGQNRSSGHVYVGFIQTGPGAVHLDQIDLTGAVTHTWTLTGVTSITSLTVNATATVAYFTQTATNSLFRKIDLTTFTITTLDTVAGSSVEDCLYLEDDTILVVYYTNSGAPTTVTVKRYATDGTVLNTYTFGGALYRSSLNPPRIGFALDSPSTFWITLKPNANFGLSEYRHVRVSDGATLATRTHANYLFGQYIGTATATPPSRFGQEKSGALLVATVANAQPVIAPLPEATAVPIVRLRRSPHIFSQNTRTFLSRLELILQPGIGTVTGQGRDAEVMIRVSRDGGFTWGAERIVSAGVLGAYTQRLQAFQFGQARDWVIEVSVSDPNVPWVLLDLFADLDEGTS